MVKVYNFTPHVQFMFEARKIYCVNFWKTFSMVCICGTLFCVRAHLPCHQEIGQMTTPTRIFYSCHSTRYSLNLICLIAIMRCNRKANVCVTMVHLHGFVKCLFVCLCCRYAMSPISLFFFCSPHLLMKMAINLHRRLLHLLVYLRNENGTAACSPH